jgi:RNA polymerase sigma-70 factor (ECF subfamily)
MERQPGGGFFDDFAKLLHEARGGSKDAKDKLYLPYRDLFDEWADRRFGMKRRPFRADRDSDVVQGIFLVAWRSFEQFKGETEEEFTSWLKTIFHNELNAQFRFHHRERRDIFRTVPLDRVAEGNLALETESPLQMIISKEEEKMAYEAIERLPDESIWCLLMRYHHDLTYEEPGQTLDCSAEAARKKCDRALVDLLEHLPAR